MDVRLRMPGALFRAASQWAAAHDTDLSDIVRRLLDLVVAEQIDPLAADPVSAAIGARGGRASAQRLTEAERRLKAQRAARTRWDGHR